MRKDTWDRLNELYNECIDLPKDEQEKFIHSHTVEDENLRKQLYELLKNESKSKDYFDDLQSRIAEQFTEFQDELLAKGDIIQNYRITEKLGSGGASVVYKASRIDEQFEKEVAVKVFRKRNTEFTFDKSKSEKQFLATLSHATIAQIYDGGTLPSGHPYIIMELVEGKLLNEYLTVHRPTEKESLGIFLKICSGVRAAHKNLILHLDIKPNNLIVTPAGDLKLLDFGIAKDFKEIHESDSVSRLTFNFAAPEQLSGARVSVATDIYQLGKTLYYLLTSGKLLTTDGEEFENRGSATNAAIHSAEISAIISKCTQADPEQRYQSVDQLIYEIENFLGGYPVESYETSDSYRLRKYVSRNRIVVTLISLVFLSISIGIFVAYREAQIAKAEKVRAVEAAELANSTKNFIFELFQEADPANTKGDTTNIYDFLQKSYNKIDDYQGQPVTKAEMFAMIASSFRAIEDYDRAEAALDKANRIFDSLGIAGSASNIMLLDNLALYHRDNGDYDKAASLYVQLFNLADELDLAKDSIYASYLKNFSYIQKTRGFVDSSYQLIKRTADLERKILKDTISMLYAETLYIKGSIEKDLEQYKKAEATLESALELVVSLEGEYHPGTQAILNSLGIIYQRLDMYSKARSLFERKSRIIRKVYGEDSRNMAVAYDNHAFLLLNKGELDSALYYNAKARAIFKKVFDGRPNNTYANTFLNTGKILSELGELDSADYYLQTALNMLVESNATDKEKAFAYYKLADNHLYQGDTVAAIAHFATCIELRQSIGIPTDEVEAKKNTLQDLYARN